MKATIAWCFAIVSCLLPFNLKAQTSIKEMPIIAYWGVPDTMSYDRCFQEFRDCGFTVSIYPYWQIDTLVKACRVADKYGIGIIGNCPELSEKPEETTQRLKQTKGFLGYFLQDEPSLPDLRQRETDIERIKKTDSTHLFYINLLPYYRQDWFTAAAKVDSYQSYVKRAAILPCQQMSFDYYPITKEGLRTTWYYNLEIIRKQCLLDKRPFWGFVLSTPHSVYPQPTIASLRLQVYANLAYGAQGIQYFTYWSPTPRNYDYHHAPIGVDGKKTKTYAIVQQMNRELKTVSRLFYGAKVTSVHHLGKKMAQGTSRPTRMPENLKKLKITGKMGAIISELEKDGHRYLVIVNKDHENTLKLSIKARNNTPVFITKQLSEAPMKTSYTIAAGDILLFRLH